MFRANHQPPPPSWTPTSLTCLRINTATDRRPNPIQPAIPCPTYFPRYAPPFAILECRFPFWVRSFRARLPPRSLHTLATLATLHVSLSATLTPRPAFSPPLMLIPFRFIRIQQPLDRLSSFQRYPTSTPRGVGLAPPRRPTPPPLSSHVPRGSVVFFEPPVQTRPTTPIG